MDLNVEPAPVFDNPAAPTETLAKPQSITSNEPLVAPLVEPQPQAQPCTSVEPVDPANAELPLITFAQAQAIHDADPAAWPGTRLRYRVSTIGVSVDDYVKLCPRDYKVIEFIRKSQAKHGIDKYDYCESTCSHMEETVDIICSLHGAFTRIAIKHYSRGYGCPECGNLSRLAKMRHTTEYFIERAVAKHGIGKYDYSKVIYTSMSAKVTIICNACGKEWQQAAHSHILQGCGCPRCGGSEKKTTDKFIEQARVIHGDAYCYDLVEYRKNDINVKIKCNTCDLIFDQMPANHLKGSRCPRCIGALVTTESFIRKAISRHGTVYDYSKVAYVNAISPVTLICVLHGEFKQTPNQHLNGHGCQECGGSKPHTRETFIERAHAVHGIGRYDYSAVSNVNGKIGITIECNICSNVFIQDASSHLAGHGCSVCHHTKIGAIRRHTKEYFVALAESKHGAGRYDYSMVNYIDSHTKVLIKCNTCMNTFEQVPISHTKKNGCPYCNESRGEKYIASALDLIAVKYDRQSLLPATLKKFDFYLSDSDLYVEFQGIQHFQFVSIFKGAEGFIKRLASDLLKIRWCLDNGHKLLSMWRNEAIDLAITFIKTSDETNLEIMCLNSLRCHLARLKPVFAYPHIHGLDDEDPQFQEVADAYDQVCAKVDSAWETLKARIWSA